MYLNYAGIYLHFVKNMTVFFGKINVIDGQLTQTTLWVVLQMDS